MIKRRTKQRRGPLRDPGYRKYLAGKSCSALSDSPNDEAFEGCDYWWHGYGFATDAAHTENNGMNSKGPDSSCAPLCRKHHREYDAGREAFEKKYRINMKAIAAEHFARYEKEKAA